MIILPKNFFFFYLKVIFFKCNLKQILKVLWSQPHKCAVFFLVCRLPLLFGSVRFIVLFDMRPNPNEVFRDFFPLKAHRPTSQILYVLSNILSYLLYSYFLHIFYAFFF
jgi:hypothetical protein